MGGVQEFTNSSINRVVANVVDIQQVIIMQFDNLTKSLDSLKLEHRDSIKDLRDDIKRIADRSQQQLDDIRKCHKEELDEIRSSNSKQVDRLLDLIKSLTLRENATIPAESTRNPAVPAIPLPMQFATGHGPAYPPQPPMTAQWLQENANRIMSQMSQMQAAHAAQLNTAQLNTAYAAQMQAAKDQANLILSSKHLNAQVAPPPTVPKPAPPPTTTATVSAPIATSTEKAQETVKPQNTIEKTIPTSTTTKVPETKPFTSTTSTSSSFSFGNAKNILNIPSTNSAAKTESKTPEKEKDDDVVEEYEPVADFKPVIPLPDLVEVKTGEEDDDVVFSHRCKLYMYVNETKEFKERGIGELKILMNKDSKKYRVVMRREQVHKVCANFPIVSSMTIMQMAKSETAYTWFCKDFSLDEPDYVKFAARFPSVEVAKLFKKQFEDAVKCTKSTGDSPMKKEVSIPPAPKESPKKEEEAKEIEIPLESKNKENVGFGDKFKPAAGSWECKECYVRNEEKSDKCVSCGTNKDGSKGDGGQIFSKSILQPPAGTPKFSFGLSAAASAKEPLTPQFATSSANQSKSTVFGGGSTPKANVFGGGAQKESGSTPMFSFGQNKSNESSTPTFSFLKSGEQSTTKSLFGGSVKTDSPVSFSFSKASESSNTTVPSFSFNNPASTSNTPSNENEKPATTKVFGGASSEQVSFASIANKGNIFDNADQTKKDAVIMKKAEPLVKKTEENQEDENDEEYEPQDDFKPVVPLPDLVEVKTGEEDEEVVFEERCKLYKYFDDIKANKERGIGNVKILKNKETNKSRVVMRREQVHKLCANFNIDKNIALMPKPNLSTVYSLVCMDYSGDAEETEVKPCKSVFTFKFKTEEIANQFKKKYDEAREQMDS